MRPPAGMLGGMNTGSLRRHLLFWTIAALGAASDLLSKSMIFDWLRFDWSTHCGVDQVVIDGFFMLQTAANPGTFFGKLSGFNNYLIIFTVLMMAVVLIMFMAPPKELSGRGWGRLYTAALALVLAGAAGNLWDRIQFGAVRDFLLFQFGSYRWPNFNLADAWLTIGIIAYILAAWRASRHEGADQAASQDSEKSAGNGQ